MDSIGTRILRCCDGHRTIDEIVIQLLQEFDVGRKELTDDVKALLYKMRVLEILI